MTWFTSPATREYKFFKENEKKMTMTTTTTYGVKTDIHTCPLFFSFWPMHFNSGIRVAWIRTTSNRQKLRVWCKIVVVCWSKNNFYFCFVLLVSKMKQKRQRQRPTTNDIDPKQEFMERQCREMEKEDAFTLHTILQL